MGWLQEDYLLLKLTTGSLKLSGMLFGLKANWNLFGYNLSEINILTMLVFKKNLCAISTFASKSFLQLKTQVFHRSFQNDLDINPSLSRIQDQP